VPGVQLISRMPNPSAKTKRVKGLISWNKDCPVKKAPHSAQKNPVCVKLPNGVADLPLMAGIKRKGLGETWVEQILRPDFNRLIMI